MLSVKNKVAPPLIEQEALEALQKYNFPGNVRELENILERALTWMEGEEITVSDLMLPLVSPDSKALKTSPDFSLNVPVKNVPSDLGAHLEDQERRLITEALESVRWNKTAAAKKLGISFRALRYKLKKLGLD